MFADDGDTRGGWLRTRVGVSRPTIAKARADLEALQAGGVDGVMCANERSTPSMSRTEPVVGICMARVIGALHDELRVPCRVDVLWDARATVELPVAVEAAFARQVFSGT